MINIRWKIVFKMLMLDFFSFIFKIKASEFTLRLNVSENSEQTWLRTEYFLKKETVLTNDSEIYS